MRDLAAVVLLSWGGGALMTLSFAAYHWAITPPEPFVRFEVVEGYHPNA